MLIQLAQFIFDSATKVFNSILADWGFIGYYIIAAPLIVRAVNFVKRMFK